MGDVNAADMSPEELRQAIPKLIGAIAQMYMLMYAIGGEEVKPMLDKYVETAGVRIEMDEVAADQIRTMFEDGD